MVDLNKIATNYQNGLISLNQGGYVGKETTIDNLTAREFLLIVDREVLSKLIELRDEAKLRCEDSEDDVSLGEYISLKDVVDRVQKFVQDAPKKIYGRPNDQYDAQRQTLYQYYQLHGSGTGRISYQNP